MIGFENYKTLLHDETFRIALKNSLLLAIGFICIQHPLALITAAVLDKLGGRAENFFRCVYFIPNVISVAVIAYLLTNGGPGNSTQFTANYLYQQAFKAFKYGYGNAIGVIFIVICLLATVLLNKVFEERDEREIKKLQKARKKGAAA